MAAAGGNNCAAGAASGVIGETFGELMHDNGNGLNRQNTILASQVIGALTAAAVAGPDDGDSVFAGSQVARNAVENNLTMFITGTDPKQKNSSSKKDISKGEKITIEQTFDEKITDFEWTGGNTKEARTEAANNLNNFISDYEFKEGEKLNIIMFSHGGNNGKEFTQLYMGSKKIDNLIFLGTPHRNDYQLDYSDLSPNANLINVYSPQDGVQTRGYFDGSPYLGVFMMPKEELRTIAGFNNIEVIQSIFTTPTSGHINLKTPEVWNNYVLPNLNQ